MDPSMVNALVGLGLLLILTGVVLFVSGIAVWAWGYSRGERDSKKSVYAEAWRHKAGHWGIDSHGDNDFVWADEDKS